MFFSHEWGPENRKTVHPLDSTPFFSGRPFLRRQSVSVVIRDGGEGEGERNTYRLSQVYCLKPFNRILCVRVRQGHITIKPTKRRKTVCQVFPLSERHLTTRSSSDNRR